LLCPRIGIYHECCAASFFLAASPEWVKKRRKAMSAVTAAFAESGHGGLVPKIARAMM
jgi:hypothetical protein